MIAQDGAVDGVGLLESLYHLQAVVRRLKLTWGLQNVRIVSSVATTEASAIGEGWIIESGATLALLPEGPVEGPLIVALFSSMLLEIILLTEEGSRVSKTPPTRLICVLSPQDTPDISALVPTRSNSVFL